MRISDWSSDVCSSDLAGVFPPLLVYMTASGESAGRLEQMLERAADYLERAFDRFTAASLALLEPVIIVVMGSCVALIILAILLPILQFQTLSGYRHFRCFTYLFTYIGNASFMCRL